MNNQFSFTRAATLGKIRAMTFALVLTPLGAGTVSTLRAQSRPAATIAHGFYVGVSERLSRVAGQATGLTGAELSWVGDHRYSVGIAAYAHLGNRLTNPRASDPRRGDALDFGYGGVGLGYTMAPVARLSLTGHILLGGGAVDYRDAAAVDDERKAFAVGEPSLRVDFALTSFARVGVEGAYRVVTHAPNVDGLRGRHVRGASIGAGIRVGHF